MAALWQHPGGDREERRHLRVCSSSSAGRAEREFWPLDSDALLLVTLEVNHDVGLIQHKQLDLFGVKQLRFPASIHHRAGRPDDDLLLELRAFGH